MHQLNVSYGMLNVTLVFYFFPIFSFTFRAQQLRHQNHFLPFLPFSDILDAGITSITIKKKSLEKSPEKKSMQKKQQEKPPNNNKKYI